LKHSRETVLFGHGLPLLKHRIKRLTYLASVPPAARLNAASSIGGNALFFRSALRRIPADALGLKKYLGGRSPASKMRDKEDSTTTLGDSEELSVQHSESEPIPELDQRPEEGTKVPPAVAGQDTGDVFPYDPPRPEFVNHAQIGEGEVAPWVFESFAESGGGERLTGGAADENSKSWKGPVIEFFQVPEVGDNGIVVLEERTREGFDLRKGHRLPPERLPRHARSLDAAAYGQVLHRPGTGGCDARRERPDGAPTVTRGAVARQLGQ
jgi:hypothetical protein